ncbi:Tetraspanin family protein [Caenorhabditis elegans]|uniref:Tetraspanin family protein n=1 Tax=Caenorhabditis elegans TaxID=6239 RepID=Q22722_CAEEL|nr:Tetraspanin family protein [Caenorhabditis elegans]CCD71504.2 Tetraspanin family protein [Caenorhabditis elegans]
MRFGKAAWLYGSNMILLLAVFLFLGATIVMLTSPLFVLIPIKKNDPYVLGYCFINICLALLCIASIVAIRKRQIGVVVFCHWIKCCTLIVDAVMVFVFASIMSTAHTSLYSHIQVLHNSSKELCSVWDNVYQTLICCPPEEVLQTCADFLNVTKSFCPTGHSNDCYIHLKRWLHSNTEIVGCLAFCVITPLKLFMIAALRKDIEKVETEMAELEYYSQMINEYDRHGDGYIESFKSNINLADSTSTQTSGISRVKSFPGYSPFLKHSVIEEVENEFTVRGDEIREELQQAIAAHNARQLEAAAVTEQF